MEVDEKGHTIEHHKGDPQNQRYKTYKSDLVQNFCLGRITFH